jgi:hypothetical protein
MKVRGRLSLVGVLAATLCWSGVALGDGIDISHPQCGAIVPAAEFTIVGVDGGRPFDVHPCLSAQVPLATAFYVNTANPGPTSLNWPNGFTSPRACNTPSASGADTLDCAFDYGWKAANNSYDAAVAAQVVAGLIPAGATSTKTPVEWWLDVESANTWRFGSAFALAANVEVIRGAIAALEARQVARVGIYSAPAHWLAITGNTTAFAGYASWLAGADTSIVASGWCGGEGFTTGGIAISQFAIHPTPTATLDGDVRCPVGVRFLSTPKQVAGQAGALSVVLNIAQGSATPVQLTSNFASDAGFALTPAGPFVPTLAVDVPPRTRTVAVYTRTTRSGKYRVSVGGVGATVDGAVTVAPAAAKTFGRIQGLHNIRKGTRRVLVITITDAFNNRILSGIRWRSSNPKVVRVTAGPNSSARITGVRRGTAIIKARVGNRTSRAFRVTVR